MKAAKVIISWLFAVWTSYVFLFSLYFKFDPSAKEPIHIFQTIGAWMSDTLGATIGNLFTNFGQYGVGGAELITSVILLAPIVIGNREKLHFIGALAAMAVMAGAIFFHLFTPLGWHPTWAVENASQCGGGAIYDAVANTCADTSLANAAVSIFVLGLVVAFINKGAVKKY